MGDDSAVKSEAFLAKKCYVRIYVRTFVPLSWYASLLLQNFFSAVWI